MRNILYIVNPISGTGNKNIIKDTIAEETTKAGIAFSIVDSVASGDYSFLHPAIAKQNITDIVIAGGDGTINRVVNTFAGGDLRFGIIPCGSGNGLAFSAGIPKNLTKSLQIIFKGEAQWTDAFTINEQFACMLCGIGFDAQVAHDFANAPKRGLLTYVRKTVSNFISSPFYPLILHTKGKEIKTKAFFLSIANSNQFGNHFTIAPKASLTDGLLDIVIMTRQNRLTMLFNTVKQISGQNKLNSVEMINDNASLIYFQTNYLRINNPGLAPVHIDGDPVETMKEIEVKVIRNAFQLIYP